MEYKRNMLWRSDGNGLYVDLFQSVRNTTVYRDATIELTRNPLKDDRLSLQYRKEGNDIVKNNAKEAIDLYNKSLCFAEIGSKISCLAYANRAACFLHLNLYEQCLTDIELAIKANYPDELMPKLEKRKIECLKLKRMNGIKKSFEPKLSFPENKNIPGLADGLEIVRNEQYGRHIVAKCNIGIDQTIMIEKPMVKLLNSSEYKRCQNCLKENMNLIACDYCTNAMFCSGMCSNNQFHNYECNMKNIRYFDGYNGVNTRSTIKFLLRTIKNGLSIFSSANQMMRFIEECRANNDVTPLSDGAPESIFQTFFKLHFDSSDELTFAIFTLIACIAYDILMGYREVKVKFESTTSQRFLMHLLTHFTAIFKANNVLLQEWCDDAGAILDKDGMETYGAGVFNIGSFFNHACMPNVIKLVNGNCSIVKTVRPIKKGDQVFIRYSINPNQPTNERRGHLQRLCGFVCYCDLCVSIGPKMIEPTSMKSDFQALSIKMARLLFGKDDSTKSLKDSCFEFLAKYRGTPTSESIIYAFEYLKQLFHREIQSM